MLLKAFFGTFGALRMGRRGIVALVCLGVLSSGVAVMPPLAFGDVISTVVDSLSHQGASHSISVGDLFRTTGLGRALLLFVVLTVLGDGLRITYGYLVTGFTNRLVVRAKGRLADAALSRTSGDEGDRTSISYMINSDCQQLSSLYSLPMTTVFADLLDSIIITVVVASISWKLALILVVPAIPIFFISRAAGRHQRLIAEGLREAEGTLNVQADHLTTDWLTIRVFGGRRMEQASTDAILNQVTELNARANSRLASLMGRVGAIRVAASLAAVAVASMLAAGGEIAVGSVATVMLYLSRFYSPAINLSKAYQIVQRGAVSAERVSTFLRQQGSDGDHAPFDGGERPSGSHVRLRSSGAEFAVPGKGRVVLHDLDVDGTGLVLVTGESGSGKTTVLRGLIGVGSDPVAGQVCVDGRRVEEWPVDERLRLFSYAGQENVLLRGPVLTSVCYPHPVDGHFRDAGLAAVSRVGLAAVAERPIGTHDQSVSGGEARRIVLARALARQAPILIADEATANLDPNTRALVERLLIEEATRRIVVLSVHDPSSELLDAANTTITLDPAP